MLSAAKPCSAASASAASRISSGVSEPRGRRARPRRVLRDSLTGLTRDHVRRTLYHVTYTVHELEDDMTFTRRRHNPPAAKQRGRAVPAAVAGRRAAIVATTIAAAAAALVAG